MENQEFYIRIDSRTEREADEKSFFKKFSKKRTKGVFPTDKYMRGFFSLLILCGVSGIGAWGQILPHRKEIHERGNRERSMGRLQMVSKRQNVVLKRQGPLHRIR